MKTKNKQKNNSKISNIFKKTWIIFGIIILFWTFFWLIKKNSYRGAYFITVAIMFTIGFYLLIIYSITSFLIILIKFYQNKK